MTVLLLPLAKRYADEHALQLPGPTKALLGVSWVVLPFVIGWWVVLLLNFVVNWPRASRVISRVSLVAAFLLSGAFVTAVALPLIKLAEGLSK